MIEKRKSNIDEQGNVLYLDEERFKRKTVGFPPHKNRSNGLGVYNFIKVNITAMKKKNWKWALRLYHFFIKFSGWMKAGGLKAFIYKKGIMLHPDMEAHTSTIIMPLDVDVTDKGEKVVLPIELIKESLKHVSYIAGMNTCLCREANECKDYPVDLACLFLGEASKSVVKNGLAKEITYEEACERVDRAAEYGLMGHAVWIEIEQLLWGVKNDEMDQFLEICFCCPCCCIGLRLARTATENERHRFQPAGWTAVPDRTKCTGCGLCVSGNHGCPMEAISFGEDGKIVINQETCVGCGFCRLKCPTNVIKIKQTMPMHDDITDYFRESYNLDLKL